MAGFYEEKQRNGNGVSRFRVTMASSRKTKEEKEKKKNKVKAKETKPTKPETKKKANRSPENNKKKTGIQNGAVSESEDEVVMTTPATSNDNDSQEESETEQDIRSQETKKPNKSGKKMQQDDDDDDEKEDSKVCNFPMERIKRIFKTQSSDFSVTGEAVFLVNKATDQFLEQFCEDAYECCAKDRKKSLAYKHLASVVSEQSRYEFLSDFVPEKIKAEEALSQRKLAEEGDEE